MYGVYGTGNIPNEPTEPSRDLFQGLVNFLAAGGSYNDYLARTFPRTAFGKEMTREAAKKYIAGLSDTARKTVLPKAASRVAAMGSRRLPLAQGILQGLSGDPIGGVGTAGGGFAGAALGAKLGMPFGPLGVAAGGLIGGSLGGGIGQGLTRTVTGIDVNNPLTGPDISLAGIPLTPYAKTKKGVKRAAELEALRLKEMLPIMERARQQQFQRDLIGSQVQMAGQLLGNIYPR